MKKFLHTAHHKGWLIGMVDGAQAKALGVTATPASSGDLFGVNAVLQGFQPDEDTVAEFSFAVGTGADRKVFIFERRPELVNSTNPPALEYIIEAMEAFRRGDQPGATLACDWFRKCCVQTGDKTASIVQALLDAHDELLFDNQERLVTEGLYTPDEAGSFILLEKKALDYHPDPYWARTTVRQVFQKEVGDLDQLYDAKKGYWVFK